jgi:hypothetical protein
MAMNASSSLSIANFNKDFPEGTGIIVRGSVVTNQRHEDGAPFDSQGKGTSDIDVTVVGKKVMEAWNENSFYIPGLHTKPLCDKDPNAAPALNELRTAVQKMVGRPVNIQATSSLVLYARDVLFGEPYYVVVPPGDDA